MSQPDRVEELIGSLEQTVRLLRRMEQGLRARRVAWVSARARDLEQPLGELQVVADQLNAEQRRSTGLLAALCSGLPRPRLPRLASPQASIGLLARHLPAALAARLRAAAAAAAAASRGLRVETALGGRLLQFARTVHEGMLCDLADAGCGPAAYDRHARRVRSLVPGTGRAGALIDGRL